MRYLPEKEFKSPNVLSWLVFKDFYNRNKHNYFSNSELFSKEFNFIWVVWYDEFSISKYGAMFETPEHVTEFLLKCNV